MLRIRKLDIYSPKKTKNKMKEIVEDGFVYWIGENAKDNWDILRTAKKQNMQWLWFHLDKMSSAYVILCATKKELKKRRALSNIKKAAALCKEHGKYKELPSVGVIYTEVGNVKKGEKIGQVTTKKTTRVVV